MGRFILRTAGIVGCAVLALTGCQASTDESAADRPITIALPPISDDPTKASPVEALVGLLEAETGRQVEVTDVPDYLSVVEAIRSDHVDIGLMSGFPSALAIGTGEVDALLSWEGDGKPVSTCVVLEDSSISTVDDIEGKTVAFADPASSSGYFMPVYMLHEAGLERDRDYEAIFAGGHDGSFAALKQGQVDAACTAVVLTEKGAPVFPFSDGEWRAVGESPSMDVMGAVLARQTLDDDTAAVLAEAIPKVFSEENREALGTLGSFVGLNVVVSPAPSAFDSFNDVAAVAGVQLGDLK